MSLSLQPASLWEDAAPGGPPVPPNEACKPHDQPTPVVANGEQPPQQPGPAPPSNHSPEPTESGRPLPSIPADMVIPEQPIVVPPDSYDLPSLGGLFGDHEVIDDPPPPPPPPAVYENFPARSTKLLGIGQMGLGLSCIICQIVAMTQVEHTDIADDWFTYLPSGIVCGVYFIICGIFTVLAGYYRTKKMIRFTVVLLCVSSSVFCVFLFIMSCIGLSFSGKSPTYRLSCELVKTGNRVYKSCPMAHPLLIVNVTMMVLSIMEFTVGIRLAVKGYKVVLGRRRNRLQCIRTPEGHLVILNRGPDYSGQPHMLPSMFVRTKTAEILFPMQTEAVLKPPPYAMDDTGQHAPPPGYQEHAPRYTVGEMCTRVADHQLEASVDTGGSTSPLGHALPVSPVHLQPASPGCLFDPTSEAVTRDAQIAGDDALGSSYQGLTGDPITQKAQRATQQSLVSPSAVVLLPGAGAGMVNEGFNVMDEVPVIYSHPSIEDTKL